MSRIQTQFMLHAEGRSQHRTHLNNEVSIFTKFGWNWLRSSIEKDKLTLLQLIPVSYKHQIKDPEKQMENYQTAICSETKMSLFNWLVPKFKLTRWGKDVSTGESIGWDLGLRGAKNDQAAYDGTP